MVLDGILLGEVLGMFLLDEGVELLAGGPEVAYGYEGHCQT